MKKMFFYLAARIPAKPMEYRLAQGTPASLILVHRKIGLKDHL
jgi:hypothetical protein